MLCYVVENPEGRQLVFWDVMPWRAPLTVREMWRAHGMRLIGIWRVKKDATAKAAA